MAAGIKTGGRKPGSANKTTTAVKEALVAAFDELGGVPALVDWARQNETEYYKLWVKVLPQEVHTNLSVTRQALPSEDEAMLIEYAGAKPE